jgi:hypothetical protein
MAARQAWGAALALGLDTPIAREIVYRAGVRAIDPEGAARKLRPEGWSRRIQRLEDFTMHEFTMAIEESRIPRSDAMHSLIGRANNQAADALSPTDAYPTGPACGRPRDEHGRFARCRAPGRHRCPR